MAAELLYLVGAFTTQNRDTEHKHPDDGFINRRIGPIFNIIVVSCQDLVRLEGCTDGCGAGDSHTLGNRLYVRAGFVVANTNCRHLSASNTADGPTVFTVVFYVVVPHLIGFGPPLASLLLQQLVVASLFS